MYTLIILIFFLNYFAELFEKISVKTIKNTRGIPSNGDYDVFFSTPRTRGPLLTPINLRQGRDTSGGAQSSVYDVSGKNTTANHEKECKD